MSDSISSQQLFGHLEQAATDLGVRADDETAPSMGRRRSRRLNRGSQRGMILVERDLPGGTIVTLEEQSAAPLSSGRRRRDAARLVGGRRIGTVPFDQLPRGDIPRALDRIDRKLTLGDEPGREFGLHEIDAKGNFLRIDSAPKSGHLLLLVHGTFSSGRTLYGNLSAEAGTAWLQHARQHYDKILSFEHPTLGLTPALNGRDLALDFGDSKARVDVVCHSRGGLVSRWWAEAFQPQIDSRVVFVGSPLAGTGLASPPNLRSSLSLVANIFRALGVAASAAPFGAFITGLFQVFSSVTSLAAKTPVTDAAIALVPGLHAMSRIANNPEIRVMRGGGNRLDLAGKYFAIQSNFEPTDPGWKFWEYFRSAKLRVADFVVDAIFDGANDLVVDTASMTDLANDHRIEEVFEFGTDAQVHHVNYFDQRETYEQLATWLS